MVTPHLWNSLGVFYKLEQKKNLLILRLRRFITDVSVYLLK